MKRQRNKEERRDGRRKREEGRRERGNVSLKANEITPDHLEETMKCSSIEMQELKETMISFVIYTHPLLHKYIKKEETNLLNIYYVTGIAQDILCA